MSASNGAVPPMTAADLWALVDLMDLDSFMQVMSVAVHSLREIAKGGRAPQARAMNALAKMEALREGMLDPKVEEQHLRASRRIRQWKDAGCPDLSQHQPVRYAAFAVGHSDRKVRA